MRIKEPASQVDTQLLSPSDKRWMAYIASRPDSTIFHHPAWLNTLADCYGYRPFVIAMHNDKGQIKAGMPVMEVRSAMTGRRWVSLPFTDYCAPLHDDPESLSQLVENLASVYQAGMVPRIEVRWALPAHPAIQSHPAYHLHIVKLTSDPDAVMKKFKRTHRQNIGTAENRGVHIERGVEREHVRRFYEMQLETRRRKGLPAQPWKFFDLLRREVLAQGQGFVLLAYKDAACLAGGVFLHWQQTLTYKYAASADEGQEYRPNNLLSWTAMLWGCEHGLTAFDLGRTDLENEGLRRFKQGWGAEETALAYSLLASEPLNSADGRLMGLMQTLIQHSPAWVCRATGELLYGHFA